MESIRDRDHICAFGFFGAYAESSAMLQEMVVYSSFLVTSSKARSP